MLPRKIHDLRHFGLGNFVRKHAALADPVVMNMQHDLRRGFNVLVKELLQNMNDELHWSVVIVQDQNAVEVRTFRLGLDFGDDGRAWTGRSIGPVIVLAHPRNESHVFFAWHLTCHDRFQV